MTNSSTPVVALMVKDPASVPPTILKVSASPSLSEAFRSMTSLVFSSTQNTPSVGTLVKVGGVFGGAEGPAPRQL